MYRYEKNGEDQDLVIDGFESGIAPSPHKGIANMQGVEISTEIGEVSAAYSRAKQTQTPIANGTLTASGGLGTSFLATSAPLNVGQWINISASTILGTPTSVTGAVLVVAGGGGGGNGASGYGAGAGGAGGVTQNNSVTLTTGSYAVVVGAGGARQADGNASSFGGSTVTAAAGGKGGDATGGGGTGLNGDNGGSGGGGGGGATPGTHGTGTASQGHDGGDGGTDGAGHGGGGGGGGGSTAGTTHAASAVGGAGGTGTSSSLSGAATTYGGGGGGGGAAGGAFGSGGTGGGGNGGDRTANDATNGTVNTGGGGGGGGDTSNGRSGNGGSGGSGIVIISVATGLITSASGGSKTTSGGNDIWTFNASDTFTITTLGVTAALNTINSGNFYISSQDGSGNITLSDYYDPTAAHINLHGTSGTATFSTTPNMGAAVAYATEIYSNGSMIQSRYYVLTNLGLVWVYDTANEGTTGFTWFLPDPSTTYYGSDTAPSGIGVLNGWLFVIAGGTIWGKQTVCLGNTVQQASTWVSVQVNYSIALSSTVLNSPPTSTNPHAVLVGHQGRLFYTDGNYIGAIFPDTSILSAGINTQSYCSYTASTTTGTIATVITGGVPFTFDASFVPQRTPAVFFTPAGGSIPSALTADTVYWIQKTTTEDSTNFNVYAAATGGSALDIQTGSSGTQYFNTFWVRGSIATAGGSSPTWSFSQQRVNLPTYEVAQSLVELGENILIGCKGNVVYTWNRVDAVATGIIFLPEDNVVNMITVNNMAYMFAGTRGNIYITDGSIASLAIKVPDYCAGVPGSPATYMNPTFTWGGAAYIRGRVYFSVFDQTASKAGNCGGIWSFVPTQNFYIGQDIGMALRLQAQNSYGSYSGGAFLVIPRITQTASQSNYWAAWESSTTSPTYGIDYSNSGTNASFPAVIETDYIKTGTFFETKTDMQIEIKLTAPLDVGATVAISERTTPTGTWTSIGTIATTSTTIDPTSLLAAYLVANYQRTQWLQLQITLTPITSSAAINTFVRLREIRIR